MLKIVQIPRRSLEEAGYCGPRMGSLKGAGYVLVDEEGIISFDGEHPYLMIGAAGKRTLQSVIDGGGFTGPMPHVASI